MGNIFAAGTEKSLVIYAQNNAIYLLMATGDVPCQPTVLADDFQSGLSETIYHKTLYYTYLNTQNEIVIKSILDVGSLFTLSATDTIQYAMPHLVLFQEKLILFYMIKNPLDNHYAVKMLLPFETDADRQQISLPGYTFSTLPTIKSFSTENNLFLQLYTPEQCQLISLSDEYKTTVYEDASSYKKDLEKFRNTAEVLEFQVKQKDTLLQRQAATITSIKNQYNDLMDTAVKYREEAHKWYGIAKGHKQ